MVITTWIPSLPGCPGEAGHGCADKEEACLYMRQGGGTGRRGNEFFDIPNDDMCQYKPLFSVLDTSVLPCNGIPVLVSTCS